MQSPYEIVITMDAVGSETGEKYRGDFRVKTLLNRRELAQADQIRRNFLGSNPEMSSERTAADAFIFGQLAIRVIEAPEWFKTAGIGGSELLDVNHLEDLLREISKAEKVRKEKLFGDAEKVAEKLAGKKK